VAAINASDALYQFALRLNDTLANGGDGSGVLPVDPGSILALFNISLDIDPAVLNEYLLLWEEVSPNVTASLQNVARCVGTHV